MILPSTTARPSVSIWPENTISNLKVSVLFIIPYLLGFVAASSETLRIWIALRKAIPAPSPDGELSENLPAPARNRSCRKWSIISLAIILTTGYTFIFWLYLTTFTRNINQIVGLVFLYFWLFFVLVEFLVQICGLNSVVVYRTPNGGHLTLNVHKSDAHRRYTYITFIIIVLSCLVIVSLALTSDMVSVSIVSAAVVHLVSKSFFGKSSVRNMLILYLLIMITLAIIIDLLRLFSQKLNSPLLELITSTLGEKWNRVTFMVPALSSVFVGGLIARMLRFDYQRHLASEPDSDESGRDDDNDNDNDDNADADEADFVTVSVPNTDSILHCYKHKELTEAVLLPQRVPSTFLKPYFIIALTAWCLYRTAIISICFRELIETGPSVRFVMAVLMEFPVVLLVLLIYAILRGEDRELWTDGENWRVTQSEGAVVLPVSDPESESDTVSTESVDVSVSACNSKS